MHALIIIIVERNEYITKEALMNVISKCYLNYIMMKTKIKYIFLTILIS
jgi:hypothetical protein